MMADDMIRPGAPNFPSASLYSRYRPRRLSLILLLPITRRSTRRYDPLCALDAFADPAHRRGGLAHRQCHLATAAAFRRCFRHGHPSGDHNPRRSA